MSITVGISDFIDDATPKAGEFARAAEAAGFDALGIRDHQADGRDAFVRLTVAALNTSRLTLYPAVSNPLTRHPSVLASLANTLQEVAPARAKLVLGGGDAASGEMGRRGASLDEMRDAVLSIRRLLAGEGVRFGEGAEIKMLNTSSPPTPVAVNASSPRMLELAGEAADEAVPMVGIHAAMVARAREHLAAGAKRAGRPVDTIPVTYMLPVCMSATTEEAQANARGIISMWLRRKQRLFGVILREMGMDIPPVQGPGDLPDALLPDLCDAMGLVGTPEQCAERLQRVVAETGAERLHFLVYGSTGEYQATLRDFERVILPSIR
ncbi:MAG: LLM class flavin-dependent oxidoreductase [Chloroflexi bacterium]|nr:LLM class flavin-dependent oxidoreductase [Chloroflexota bacterium]